LQGATLQARTRNAFLKINKDWKGGKPDIQAGFEINL
jgi:hypothetical protein